jgi:hypothetical protein
MEAIEENFLCVGDPGRVNVYEEWEAEAALLSFRGAGPSSELSTEDLARAGQAASHPIVRSTVGVPRFAARPALIGIGG